MSTVATPRYPAAPLRGILWPTLFAAALSATVVAAAVAGGYAMPLLAVTVLLLFVAAAFIDRRLVIPLAIVVMPLEIIWQISALHVSGVPLLDRFTNSTLLNVRLVILGLGAYWAITERTSWEERLPQGRLVFPALLLLVLYVFGAMIVRDRGFERQPQVEGALVPLSPSSQESILVTMALVLHIAFFMVIPYFVRSWQSFRLCIWALVLVGVALAFAGIYQQITGVYFWNPNLGLADVPRINATLRDPNIYARLLVLSMVLAIAAVFTLPARWRIAAAAALLAPLGMALIATHSRSGWLIAAGILPLTVICMPLSARTRLYATVAAAVGLALLIMFGDFLLGASFTQRLSTFSDGVTGVLGGRYFLIQGGWQIFLDNPLFGVGLAGFQDAFQGPYRYYHYLLEYRLSLSHTDIITILAELGLVGAVVVGFLFVRFGATIMEVYRATGGANRAMVAGLAICVFVIFASAQAEGRLLSEPYLWLIFGLALAAEGIVRRGRQSADGGTG